MRRRNFITLLGGAAVWPVVARAQDARKVHRVALIFPNAPVSDMTGFEPVSRYARAFLRSLRDL